MITTPTHEPASSGDGQCANLPARRRAVNGRLPCISHWPPQLWQILLIRLAMAMIVRMGGLPKDLGSRLASAT